MTEPTPPPTPPTPPPTNPNFGSSAPEDTAYLFSIVKVIRGRESKKIAEMQTQGWELVSETAGTLRSELKFRRVRPKGLSSYIAQGFATFRRLESRTQLRILAGVGVLVLIVIVAGIVAGANGKDATPTASPTASPRTTAPATPSETPSEQGSEQPSPPSTLTPTNITVDALLDKLNAANYAGIKVGDEFALTGVLFESNAWDVGGSGQYNVYLKAKGGKDDLSVFVNESDANNWQDGTKVKMVVQMIEITIDGETSAGWLKAVSATTLSGDTTSAG